MDFEDLPEPSRSFTAQFNSTCANCGETLRTGQEARFEGNDAVHMKCPIKREPCPRCFVVHGITQEECEI